MKSKPCRSPKRSRRKGKFVDKLYRRRANFECLENRLLLAVTPDLISPNQVNLVGTTAADEVYLRIDAGKLEYSTDGAAWTNDLSASAGVQSMTVSSASEISVNLGNGDDTLHLDFSLNALPAGAALTFSAGAGNDTLVSEVSGNDDFQLSANQLVAGSATFTFNSVENAELTGSTGTNRFELSGWNGSATLKGASGNDEYQLDSASSSVSIVDSGSGDAFTPPIGKTRLNAGLNDLVDAANELSETGPLGQDVPFLDSASGQTIGGFLDLADILDVYVVDKINSEPSDTKLHSLVKTLDVTDNTGPLTGDVAVTGTLLAGGGMNLDVSLDVSRVSSVELNVFAGELQSLLTLPDDTKLFGDLTTRVQWDFQIGVDAAGNFVGDFNTSDMIVTAAVDENLDFEARAGFLGVNAAGPLDLDMQITVDTDNLLSVDATTLSQTIGTATDDLTIALDVTPLAGITGVGSGSLQYVNARAYDSSIEPSITKTNFDDIEPFYNTDAGTLRTLLVDDFHSLLQVFGPAALAVPVPYTGALFSDVFDLADLYDQQIVDKLPLIPDVGANFSTIQQLASLTAPVLRGVNYSNHSLSFLVGISETLPDSQYDLMVSDFGSLTGIQSANKLNVASPAVAMSFPFEMDLTTVGTPLDAAALVTSLNGGEGVNTVGTISGTSSGPVIDSAETVVDESTVMLFDVDAEFGGTDALVGRVIEITSGTGAGQSRTIVANSLDTITVDSPWGVVPDATSAYAVAAADMQVQLSSGTSFTVDLDFAPNTATVASLVAKIFDAAETAGVSTPRTVGVAGDWDLDVQVESDGLVLKDRTTSGSSILGTVAAEIIVDSASDPDPADNNTLTGSGFIAGALVGRTVELLDGPGGNVVDSRQIVGNSSTVLTLNGPWDDAVSVGTHFRIPTTFSLAALNGSSAVTDLGLSGTGAQVPFRTTTGINVAGGMPVSLSGDASPDLTITLGGSTGSFGVNLDGASTGQEIVDRIRAAIPASLKATASGDPAKFEVILADSGAIYLVDSAAAGTRSSFQVSGVAEGDLFAKPVEMLDADLNDDPVADERVIVMTAPAKTISGDPLHGDTPVKHFYLAENAGSAPHVSTSLSVNAAAATGTAQWGALGVAFQGGTVTTLTPFTAAITIDPRDPEASPTGTPLPLPASLSSIKQLLSDPNSLIAGRAAVVAGQAQLDLDVSPDPSVTITNSVGAGAAQLRSTIDFTTDTQAGSNQISIVTADPTFLNATANDTKTLLEAVQELSIDDLMSALRNARDYLLELQSQSELAENLPGLPISIGELFDFGTKFELQIDKLAEAEPQTLQELASQLDTILDDVIPLSAAMSFDAAAQDLKLALRLDLDTILNAPYPLNLNISDLGTDLSTLGLSAVGSIVDVTSASPLDVTADGTIKLDVGIDLSNASDPAPFLYGDSAPNSGTGASFNISAKNENLSFPVLFGSMQVDVASGSFVLDTDGFGVATAGAAYSVGLQSDAILGTTAHAKAAALPSRTSVSIAGEADAQFTLEFPNSVIPASAPTAIFPAINVRIGDLNAPSASSTSSVTTNLVGGAGNWPTFDSLSQNFSLSDSMNGFKLGFFELFTKLDESLDTSLFGLEIPLVGTQLAEASDFLLQIRDTVTDNLSLLSDVLTPDSIRQSLFDALGPGGLGWLQDGDDADNAINIEDVQTTFEKTTPSGGRELVVGVEYDLDLMMPPELLDFPVALDLLLPGLGLDIDALAQVMIGFHLPLKVGISTADGVYIDVDLAKDLDVSLDVSLPSSIVSMAGDPQLTFTSATVLNPEPTLFRDRGSWILDGFKVGQIIKVADSDDDSQVFNEGEYVIKSIDTAGTTLTLFANQLGAAEIRSQGSLENFRVTVSKVSMTGGSNLTFTSPRTISRDTGTWFDDGFRIGDHVQFSGTANNNTIYTIAALAADGKTIQVEQTVAPESNVANVFASIGTLNYTSSGAPTGSGNQGNEADPIGYFHGFDATMGILPYRVWDSTPGESELTGTFQFDLLDPNVIGGKERLSVNDLRGINTRQKAPRGGFVAAPLSDLMTITTDPNDPLDLRDIKLNIETALAPGSAFAPYRSELTISNWNFYVNNSLLTENNRTEGEIHFDDVQFEFVSFMRVFVGPGLQRLDVAFEAFEPITNFLESEAFPILSLLFGRSNYISAAGTFGGEAEVGDYLGASVAIKQLVHGGTPFERDALIEFFSDIFNSNPWDDVAVLPIDQLIGSAWIDVGGFTVDFEKARDSAQTRPIAPVTDAANVVAPANESLEEYYARRGWNDTPTRLFGNIDDKPLALTGASTLTFEAGTSRIGRASNGAKTELEVLFLPSNWSEGQIVRASGSWLADGFQEQMYLTFDAQVPPGGTPSAYDGQAFRIIEATATHLTVEWGDAAGLTTAPTVEFGTFSGNFATWITDGFEVGQTIEVKGTDENDGTATITAVTAAYITITKTGGVVDETIDSRNGVSITAANPDGTKGSIFGQIMALARDPQQATLAGAAANSFIVTQLLPGRNAIDGVLSGAGLALTTKIDPIDFPMLKDERNAFGVLLGDTTFYGAEVKATGDILPEERVLIPDGFGNLDFLLDGYNLVEVQLAEHDSMLMNYGTPELFVALYQDFPLSKEKFFCEVPGLGFTCDAIPLTEIAPTPFISINFEARADFAIGWDATGLGLFGKTGNPHDLVEGFYFDDSEGIAPTPSLLVNDDRSGDERTNFGNFSYSTGLGAASTSNANSLLNDEPQARVLGGIGGGVYIGYSKFGLNFKLGTELTFLVGWDWNLHDPDNSDSLYRVRASEFDTLTGFGSDAGHVAADAYDEGFRFEVRWDLFTKLKVFVTIVDLRINIITVGRTLPVDIPTFIEPNLGSLDGASLLTLGFLPTDNVLYVGAYGEYNHDTDRQDIVVSGQNYHKIFRNVASISGVAGAGDDIVIVSKEVLLPTSLSGGLGNDILIAGGGRTILYGNEGDDYLKGGPVNDIIRGGDGDDTIFGGDGNDTISGGIGRDIIRGWRDDDDIDGGDDNDAIDGGTGNDIIKGGWGDDIILGGLGRDIIYGGDGSDTIEGGRDADIIYGDGSTTAIDVEMHGDVIYGGLGNDTIDGGSGPDRIFGQQHNDRLVGGVGNDLLDGGGASDRMFGGDGDDLLRSREGNDILNGEAGDDTFHVNFQGGKANSLIQVLESGPASDTDVFVAFGTLYDDHFLLRASADGSNAFVAMLNDPDHDITDLDYDPAVERINYLGVERILINGSLGDDHFAVDDTAAEITINGEAGDDTFQIGQLFRSERNEQDANVSVGDVFATIETTRGFLSNGISKPLTVNGGLGSDRFIVFHNRAVLSLNGDEGDDNFEVRAFALAGSQEPQRERTDISGGAGADLVQYAVNAPVNINGGDGFDTLIVIGTEFGDDFVVTDGGVFGGGLTINFTNIESLRVDGAEGNDRFYVESTGETFLTELFGGLGEDTFNMSGDTPPVVSNDLKGHSGIIANDVTFSDDVRYEDLTIYGVSANVADNDEPFVVIRESNGSTIITEDSTSNFLDYYDVVLSRAPMPGFDVFVKALAPLLTPDQREMGALAFRLRGPAGADEKADGSAVTLRFTVDNWYIPQRVEILADSVTQTDTGQLFTRPEIKQAVPYDGSFTYDDDAFEGVRSAVINHLVTSAVVTLEGNPIQLVGSPTLTIDTNRRFFEFLGEDVSITLDDGRIQTRRIIDATLVDGQMKLTVDRAWLSGTGVPTTTSSFSIDLDGTLLTGNPAIDATNPTFTISNPIAVSSALSSPDDLLGRQVTIIDGLGIGQSRFITGVTGDVVDADLTLTLDRGWLLSDMPDTDSSYQIRIDDAIVGRVTAIDESPTALPADKNFPPTLDNRTTFSDIDTNFRLTSNGAEGLRGAVLQLIGGPGAGQERLILGTVDDNTLILNGPWRTNPVAGETLYRITRYDGLPTASVSVEIKDNDKAGLIVDETRGYQNGDVADSHTVTAVIEGGDGDHLGEQDVVRVRLTRAPVGVVTVKLVYEGTQLELQNLDGTPIANNELTFGADWSEFQDVRVVAKADGLREGFHTSQIEFIISDLAGGGISTASDADRTLATTDEFIISSDAPVEFVGLSQHPIAISNVTYNSQTLSVYDPINAPKGGSSGAPVYEIVSNKIVFRANGEYTTVVGNGLSVSYTYTDPGFAGAFTRPIVAKINDVDAPTVLVRETGGSTDVIEVTKVDGPTKPNEIPDSFHTGDSPFEDLFEVVLTAMPDNGVGGGSVQILVTPEITKTTRTGGIRTDDIQVELFDMDLIGGPRMVSDGNGNFYVTFTQSNWDVPVRIGVRAKDDAVVDGGDTKVFADGPNTLSQILGPVVVDGAGGEGSLVGISPPVSLPNETNVKESTGNVDSVSGTSVQFTLDAAQKIELGLESDLSDIGELVGKTIEITGVTTGDPNDPVVGQFRLITAATSLNNVVTLTIDETFVVSDDDLIRSYAITSESLNFFVNEPELVDVMFIHDEDSPADSDGFLTANRLWGLNMGPDVTIGNRLRAGGITYGNLEVLQIDLGSGNNNFQVLGTHTRPENVETPEVEFFQTWTFLHTGNDIIWNGVQGDTITVDVDADDQIVTSGNVSSSTNATQSSFATLQDTSGSFGATDSLVGYKLLINPGTGTEQVRTILGNNGDTLTLDGVWETLPDSSDTYAIKKLADGSLAINAQDGNDIADASGSTLGVVVFGGLGDDTITGGSGDDILFGDQGRVDFFSEEDAYGNHSIVTRLGTAPTPITGLVDGDFNISQNLRDSQADFPEADGFDMGLVGLFVDINNGTGFLQSPRLITANTDKSLIISPNFTETLDATSAYRISTYPEDQTDGVRREANLILTVNDGEGGNDTIIGGLGGDQILGGAGNDDIDGQSGDDVILGDTGAIDRTSVPADGAAGFQSLIARVRTKSPAIGGSDRISGGNDNDIILAGTGTDYVNFSRDANPLTPESGDDLIVGDNGVADFDIASGQSILVRIETNAANHGDQDFITAGAGEKIIFGGAGGDELLAGSDNEADIVVGDEGVAIFDAVTGIVSSVSTATPAIGGDDTIRAGNASNILIGGNGADDVRGGSLRDIIIGDNGIANFDAAGILVDITTSDSSEGAGDNIDSGDGDDIVFGGAGSDFINIDRTTLALLGTDTGNDLILGDHGRATFVVAGATSSLTLFESIDPTMGDDDHIFSGGGEDIVFGGTGGDTIFGGDDHDILLGDHGRLDNTLVINHDPASYCTAIDIVPQAANQPVLSIFTGDLDGGGNDTIHGDAGDDFILGQQGDDILFGDDGDDDITGGHNVLGGKDGNDTIHGGNDSDVVLGDNGLILRTEITVSPTTWERYPAPHADAIRQVQRFDDIDLISGNDIIFGDAGRDILHGQRGNDEIDGGADDDEIMGDLGDDILRGGSGPDIVLGDVGYIHRAFNGDGTARLNPDGTPHREVYLEETATLVGTIELDTTPLRSLDPDLAAKILQADMVVLAGNYEADGSRALQPDNDAWRTSLLLLEFEPAGHDTILGDDGDDVLIGQRGNDNLSGNAGNDSVFGDGLSNLSPMQTDLPHVFNGIRLAGLTAPQHTLPTADSCGWAFMTPATLYPEVMDMNSAFDIDFSSANTLPDVTDAVLNQVGAGPLTLPDGTSISPMLAIVPDVVGHESVLPGNDTIDGGDGDDLLVGDNGSVFSPMKTGLSEIDAAASDAQDALAAVKHTLSTLAIDFDHVQHDINLIADTKTIEIGRDNIVGGNGADQIIGDDGQIVASFITGLPVAESDFVDAALDKHQSLRDLQHAAIDLENVLFESHYQVLNQLIAANISSGADHDHHDLLIGNDTIDGQQGDDLVIGDRGTILTPAVNGQRLDQVELDSPIDASVWQAARDALTAQQTLVHSGLTSHIATEHNRDSRTIAESALASIIADYRYELQIGDDTIRGNLGDDTLIGDFGILINPVVLQNPSTPAESDQLDNNLSDLLNDVHDFLIERHHEFDFDDLHARYSHPEFAHRGGTSQEVKILAGNDVMHGDAGDDVILGDSLAILTVHLSETPDLLYDYPDPGAVEFEYLWRENFELATQYRRDDGMSEISNDLIYGGLGNDSLYGQHRDDSLYGEEGDDLVYGGDGGVDTIDGGTGVNDARSRGDDLPKQVPLQRLKQLVFGTVGKLFSPLLKNVAEDAALQGNPLAINNDPDIVFNAIFAEGALFEASGLTPNSSIMFAWGFEPGLSLLSEFGVILSIADPSVTIVATTDANGNATGTVPIPLSAIGKEYLFQAFEVAATPTASNLARLNLAGAPLVVSDNNAAPELVDDLPSFVATVGQRFSFDIADAPFVDSDSDHSLIYDARLTDGSPLPSWISFNPDDLSFDAAHIPNDGSWSIIVTAIDRGTPVKYSSTTFALRAYSDRSIWQNAINQTDVNQDGVVTAVDADLILDGLRSRTFQSLPTQRTESEGLLDVNGDQRLTPVDALRVLNILNAEQLRNSTGETITPPVGENSEREAIEEAEWIVQESSSSFLRVDKATQYPVPTANQYSELIPVAAVDAALTDDEPKSQEEWHELIDTVLGEFNN